MSQSYQCMRHYIMTMSQTLTKPAWPEATTCVTRAGWKYHSTIPSPPLYFAVTKRQCFGRAQNHKMSVASHIMALNIHTPASPPSTTFTRPCFCQKPMIKCTPLDLYSFIVSCQRFHFTPSPHPPLLLHSLSLPPFLCHHASLSQWVER